MIRLEPTERGVRALDHANVEVSVTAEEWVVADEDRDLPRPTDAVVAAYATELRFPAAYVSVQRTDGEQFELGNDTGPLELPAGENLLDISTKIKSYLEFEGAASVRKTPDFEELIVEFPRQRPVTLGFRSRHERPVGTITVEPTPEGIATALSYLHSATKTTSPDRSFPTLRGHPPRVETGETTTVPSAIEAANERSGIELVVPPDVDCLYVLSSLAYYLQASVTIGDQSSPVLRAPAAGVERVLPGLPELQAETARLLRHVFYLDCLVRNAGPHGTDLSELSVLSGLSLDPEQAYHADPQERLASYLEVPTGPVADAMPEWHLSTYVEPDPARIRSVPFLLDKMSLVYLPESSELTGSELLEFSLEDFYRSQNGVADIDVVKPELQHGRVHGWLADGIPIDVFKGTHAAFENRLDYLGRDSEGMDVAVVLNDEEMETEHGEVADIYRERAEDLPMSVTVHEFLDRDELAAVFEAENDFVHYIGHCEETGLRCPDGNLSVSDIRESNTQTFFLNACGSYYEGMELLEKGSVAGAVTFKEVLEKQAVKVGTAFARLLVHGFSFARAMQLARRRIMTGKDYAVVGDGTYQLTQHRSVLPMLHRLDDEGDRYRLTADVFSAWTTGSIYYVTIGNDNDDKYLCGNESVYDVDQQQLVDFLERVSSPFIYDGDFYWSTQLRNAILGQGPE
jgi:hypothetical protein